MHASDRLKGLETFVEVVEAGSFTAAANRLNVTNSAVGKAIARLEERVGSRLFERTTRRLQLTDAGDAFFHACTRILADLEEAERALHAVDAIPSGHVRIDLPATFGRLRVLPTLLDFACKYPQIIPQVSFTDRFVDLVEDKLDVIVRIGGPDLWPADISHHYLGHEQLVFCASPAYLDQHGHPRSAEELLTHQAVLYGNTDGSPSPWFLSQEHGPATRRHARGRIVLGQAEAQVAAVEAGCGVAQLATWLIGQQLREGTLINILPDLSTQGLPLHILWQRSRQHLPKIGALISHLRVLTIS